MLANYRMELSSVGNVLGGRGLGAKEERLSCVGVGA